MKYGLVFLLLFLIVGCEKKELHYGPYSIGRDQSWFPIQLDSMQPNLNAFTNALVQEIAKTEAIPLEIINFERNQLFQVLEDDEIAGIFTSLAPNIITKEKYTFSDPFVLLGPVLIVPSTSQATSLNDLEGKIVAVNQFDDSVLIVQQWATIVIKLYQNKRMALEDLRDGFIDGVLMPFLDAQALVSTVFSEQLKIVTPPLNNKALRLITLKGSHRSLIRYFNRGLNRIKASGKYDQLRTTYQLF